MKNINITGIDFGSNEGARDSLERYYLDTGIYSKLSNKKKTLIIGRKGVGKTALASQVMKSSRANYNEFSSILSFRAIPVAIMESFEDKDLTNSSRFIHLWKFIILIELSKLVVKNESLSPEREQRLRSIIECVAPSLESSTESYLKATKKKGFQFSLPKVATYNSSQEIRSESVELLDYNQALQDILIESADISTKYTVILDELDDSYTSSDKYFDLIISMFKSVNDLNIEFLNSYKGLQVFVALRDDIYNQIEYSDKNKWDDNALKIDWIPSPQTKAKDTDLYKMINLRIGASYEDVPDPDHDYWNMAFEYGNVYDKLNSFQYILSRTFYRPRDVIQYCKCIQECAGKEQQKFSHKNILDAEMSYSVWLQKELHDEMHTVLPEINEVLEVLKKNKQPSFDVKQVIEPLNRINYSKGYTHEEVLEILFEFSVIGVFEKDITQKAPRFRYRNPYIKYDSERRYAIHYGLRHALRFSIDDMRVKRQQGTSKYKKQPQGRRSKKTKPKSQQNQSRAKKSSDANLKDIWPKKN